MHALLLNFWSDRPRSGKRNGKEDGITHTHRSMTRKCVTVPFSCLQFLSNNRKHPRIPCISFSIDCCGKCYHGSTTMWTQFNHRFWISELSHSLASAIWDKSVWQCFSWFYRYSSALIGDRIWCRRFDRSVRIERRRKEQKCVVFRMHVARTEKNRLCMRHWWWLVRWHLTCVRPLVNGRRTYSLQLNYFLCFVCSNIKFGETKAAHQKKKKRRKKTRSTQKKREKKYK